MNSPVKIFFFFFAITGWTILLIIHVLSFADVDLTDKISYGWILKIGIFVVCLAAFYQLKKNEKSKEFQKPGNQPGVNFFAYLNLILKNAPGWLDVITRLSIFYAIVNFIVCIYTLTGIPSIVNDEYVLWDHGRIIKRLTESEYHHFRAKMIRGFSGHYLIFYAFAAAVLYPFKAASEKPANTTN